MLKTHQLTCIRNNQILFSNLNLELLPGEILHIVGANGSGKSSLLHILTGTLSATQGCIHWKNMQIVNNSHYLAHLVYVGHKTGVKNGLTALENLQLAASLNATQIDIDWTGALEYFDLSLLKNVLCENLSAGQKQRVALTRLLMHSSPSLWILDEPFTALDQIGSLKLKSLLQRHVKRDGLVVLTSHQPIELGGVAIKQIQL